MLTLEAGPAHPTPALPAANEPRRPMRMVVRRRRVLAVLVTTAAAFAVLGLAPALRGLWWASAACGLLAAGYVCLVGILRHVQVRRELLLAFGHDELVQELEWTDLERRLDPAGESEMASGCCQPVAVGNRAIARFVVSYALGWILIPVVGAIRLMRGDLDHLDRHGVMARIVRLQQYGRSQSLRLLTVGAAATVGVTAIGSATGTVSASARTSDRTLATAPSTLVATPATKVNASGVSYTVRRGDTLSGIAARYGTAVGSIASANGIANPRLIFPGQVFAIPDAVIETARPPAAESSYTVRPGDTLTAIADRFGTTVGAIAAANGVANPNLIFPGQVFVIPGSGLALSVPAAQPVWRPTRSRPVVVSRRWSPPQIVRAAPVVANPSVAHPSPIPSKPIDTAPAVRLVSAVAPALPRLPVPEVRIVSVTPRSSTPVGPSGYVNPFLRGSWAAARTDQGVDWIPKAASPVVAIGDGVVTYSSTSSGWPGGAFISYRLTSGSHAGLYIYVAEHLTNLLPVGTTISAGQVIATALPGYPWTEWGWAAPHGPSPAASAQYHGAADGAATPGGKAFARFLMELGVKPAQDPGPGPDRP